MKISKFLGLAFATLCFVNTGWSMQDSGSKMLNLELPGSSIANSNNPMDTISMQQRLSALDVEIRNFIQDLKQTAQNATFAQQMEIDDMLNTATPQINELLESVKELRQKICGQPA